MKVWSLHQTLYPLLRAFPLTRKDRLRRLATEGSRSFPLTRNTGGGDWLRKDSLRRRWLALQSPAQRSCTRTTTPSPGLNAHRRLRARLPGPYVSSPLPLHLPPLSLQGARGRVAALTRPSLLYGRRELPLRRGLLQRAHGTDVSIPCRQPHGESQSDL